MPVSNVLIHRLRLQLYQKLEKEWAYKWKNSNNGKYGETFSTFEAIPNKNSFYEELMDDINETLKQHFGSLEMASKYSISTSSIKRFLNKNYESTFDERVRDTMAIYVGFKDWSDFERNCTPKPSISKIWVGVGLIGLAIVAMWVYKKTKPSDVSNISINKATLTLRSATNHCYVPTKVKFAYDISNVGTFDSAFINYDGFKVPLSTPKGVIDYLYLQPKNSPVYIRVNSQGKEFLKIFSFNIKTQDWIAHSRNTKGVQLKCYEFKNNGVLHVLPYTISEEQRRSDFYINFTKIDDFQVAIDSLELIVRIKNPALDGGISCYDSGITLFGENQRGVTSFSMNLLHPSCKEFSAVRINKAVVGYDHLKRKKANDFAGLLADLSNWRVVRVRFCQNQLEIFTDQKSLVKFPYDTTLGLLKTINIGFKGSGSVDYVKVINSYTKKLVYSDDFN